jgi:hypothetical protein
MSVDGLNSAVTSYSESCRVVSRSYCMPRRHSPQATNSHSSGESVYCVAVPERGGEVALWILWAGIRLPGLIYPLVRPMVLHRNTI